MKRPQLKDLCENATHSCHTCMLSTGLICIKIVQNNFQNINISARYATDDVNVEVFFNSQVYFLNNV